MMACCVRDCDSDRSHEHHRPGWKIPNVDEAYLLYIARVCGDCTDIWENKGIRLKFTICGGLAFVNEIWIEKEEKTIEKETY